MGSARRRPSNARQQVIDFRALPRTEPPLQDEPSPPYMAYSGNYTPQTQYATSPASRQGTPSGFPVGTSHRLSRLGEPDSRVTPPRAALARAADNDDSNRGNKNKPALPASPAPGKSKRVRTGCLTCRERHLKCDEGVPECNNCQKSNRECRRGVRLNFIDVQVNEPPCIPPTTEWSVQILDESRLIASEYKGGLGRYPRSATPVVATELDVPVREQTRPAGSQPNLVSSHVIATRRVAPEIRDRYNPRDVGQPPPYTSPNHEELHSGRAVASAPAPESQPSFAGPAEDGLKLALPANYRPEKDEAALHQPNLRNSHVLDINLSLISPNPGPEPPFKRLCHNGYSGPNQLPGIQPGPLPQPLTPSTGRSAGERDYLNADDEIQFMRAFIDDVAAWMDILDQGKHFANTVPYMALRSPMMLNAVLACGAWQLTVAGEQTEERANYYYDLATTQLLRSQRDQDRNIIESAITAVVLDAYQIMSDKTNQGMDHISLARTLIRECQWEATSHGIGAACFWVNIGMEVLRCIACGWHTTWDPDQWGLDLEFTTLGGASRSGSASVIGGEDSGRGSVGPFGRRFPFMDTNPDVGDEELWVQRILYILTKVTNFRASIPQFQEPSPHDEQVRLQSRYAEWRKLRDMYNSWNSNCPRSMRPYGYSPGPSAKSLFPNVWLVKSSAKLGRLFYHTTVCLWAQLDPLNPRDSRENRASQLHHAHHICGIVAHTNERAVCLVAIRSLAVVSTVLVDQHEQSEVLEVLGRIRRETGWQVRKVVEDMKRVWGWEVLGPTPPVSTPNLGVAGSLPVAGLLGQ